jgi:hypothetical protein
MQLHEYESYEQYKEIQIRTNKKKLKKVFCGANELSLIVNYIKDKNLKVEHGVCHGVRRGFENQYFKDQLNADVFGTEISDTATKFTDVIEWDFHEVKEEWIKKFDLIYSNSMDHSYKPKECLDAWMSTLSDNGRLYLHWTKYSLPKHSNQKDPFGASFEEYKAMIEEKYEIENILVLPSKRKTKIFVVKKK